MTQVLFHLRYTLSRRQRFILLIRAWSLPFVVLVISLLLFFLVQTFLQCSIVFGLFSLLLLICFQQIFRVLVEVILVPKREMDVTFEKQWRLGARCRDSNGEGPLVSFSRWNNGYSKAGEKYMDPAALQWDRTPYIRLCNNRRTIRVYPVDCERRSNTWRHQKGNWARKKD